MLRGACAGDPFPDDWYDGDRLRAKAICVTRCTVRQQCDTWARENRERNGVWAGLDREIADRKPTPRLYCQLGHLIEGDNLRDTSAGRLCRECDNTKRKQRRAADTNRGVAA